MQPKTTKRHPINVAELRRGLGQRRTVEFDYLFEPVEVVSSRTTTDPVTGSVVIESIERGVSVLGLVSFSWEGECRRCLDLVKGQSSIEIDEIFQTPAPEDSDILELVDNTLDLVPVVKDAIGLAVPLVPLCQADCQGPDPDRYPTKSAEQVEAERAAEKGQDPRWARLDELTFED